MKLFAAVRDGVVWGLGPTEGRARTDAETRLVERARGRCARPVPAIEVHPISLDECRQIARTECFVRWPLAGRPIAPQQIGLFT